jgi:alpha-ribazole phosphatase
MEIYLVRHTTPHIDKGICYGVSDIPLATSFEKELRVLKQKLPSDKNIPYYCSPLSRCKKLAETLEPTQVIYDHRLQEMNFGAWELKKWEEINQDALEYWVEDYINRPCPSGEAFIELYHRSIAVFEEIKKIEQTTIIVISHSGVIRSILTAVLEMPLNKAHSFKLDYGSVSKIEIDDNIVSVTCLNL